MSFGNLWTAVLMMGVLIGCIPAFFQVDQVFAISSGDDFNDNKKDPEKWGPDKVYGHGVLTDTNGRLEHTCRVGTQYPPGDEVDRPWVLTRLPYNVDWDVQIDVVNLVSPSDRGQESSFGIKLASPYSKQTFLTAELYASSDGGPPRRRFFSEMVTSGNFIWNDPGDMGVTRGAVRIAFNSATKIITVFYDTEIDDGYQWVPYGSFGIAGGGGANGYSNWNLTENDFFRVFVFGYSSNMSISSGELFGDNFSQAGGVPLSVVWTNYDEMDVGESNATGVATLGTKCYVAVSGQGKDGAWYGQVRAYKKTGTLQWSSEFFNIQGGRTTAVALRGSTLFLTGYKGVAGSGLEEVFVRAYTVSGGAFLWEYAADAPRAGLYPVGIAVLGSHLVGFFNTDDGTLRGKLFALTQSTGDLKWITEFGDDIYPSAKVNAITLQGTKIAAAGYHQDGVGLKWCAVRTYSALNGEAERTHRFRPEGAGRDNESLAISWKGAILAAAGYVSPDTSTRIGHVWAIIAEGGVTREKHLDDVRELGNDSRCTEVVVIGKQIYTAGYALDASERKAFVGAYDTGKEYPSARLWGEPFELTHSSSVVTTGMTKANNRICVTGYGLGPSGAKDWFVKAYSLTGDAEWVDEFNLNGGDGSEAHGIAAARGIIFTVGQARNGPEGSVGMAVRAYSP